MNISGQLHERSQQAAAGHLFVKYQERNGEIEDRVIYMRFRQLPS